MKRAVAIFLTLLVTAGFISAVVLLFMKKPGDALTVAIAAYIPAYILAYVTK